MGPFQRGRHVQAFILLCLTDGPAYGLELQERINTLIPGNRMDQPFIYRTLNRLEKEGRVKVRLDDSQRGPVRKYYTLTDLGYQELDFFADEIRFRVRNLSIFLEKYAALGGKTKKET